MAYRVWVKGEHGGGHWSLLIWEAFDSKGAAEEAMKRILTRFMVSIPTDDFEVREDKG